MASHTVGQLASVVTSRLVEAGPVTMVVDVLRSFGRDKPLALSLAVSASGLVVANLSQIKSLAKTKKERSQKPTPPAGARKKKAIGVDARFISRLKYILRIAIPSFKSREALILITQTAVLIARSLLSIRMARLGGDGLKAVVLRSWKKFFKVLTDFAVSGMTAAVINSALKYLTNLLTVCCRERITDHVHNRYLTGRNYYRAAVLRAPGDTRMENADQRIVQDLADVCKSAADLFSRTFKPLLDVVLSTQQLSAALGFRGPSVLYAYFVVAAAALRVITPPFSRYTARANELEGKFRASHSRVISHAEEIAFMQGNAAEKEILNGQFHKVTAHTRMDILHHFWHGIAQQYLTKYLASCIGYPVLALPFLIYDQGGPAEMAAKYRYSDVLVRNSSAAIGDLMMIVPKVQKLAAYTARVAEMLEALEEMCAEGSQDNGGKRLMSKDETVTFERVCVYTPDSRLLLKDLSTTLTPGVNVLITGPNGAGKTSLFRVLAGLWPLQSGTLTRPEDAGASQLFYVPQRPYLVTGTLADQVVYPLTPAAAHARDPQYRDSIVQCLKWAGLSGVLEHEGGLDAEHADWENVLSGGEKQRMVLARLYFHRPRWAVLDEVTSAINVDEEGAMYERAIELGITVFSIAHRPSLRKFHQKQLTLAGDGSGAYAITDIEE